MNTHRHLYNHLLLLMILIPLNALPPSIFVSSFLFRRNNSFTARLLLMFTAGNLLVSPVAL